MPLFVNAESPEAAPDRCPVCGAVGEKTPVESYRDPIGGKEYRLFLCPPCGVQFAWPFKHPGGAWYEAFSPADSYEGTDPARYRLLLKDKVTGAPTLLDVGCGIGAFLAEAKRAGYRVWGIDINASAVEEARRRGLTEVFRGGLEAFCKAHPEARFDVVTLFDCLEHLDDVNAALERVKGLLAPGGKVVITVPNAERSLLFGRDTFDQPPHHLTRWTVSALTRFLERNGFAVTELDDSYLPTWEFSRHFINAATRGTLAAVKQILYGRRAARQETLTGLLQRTEAGFPKELLRSKASRLRILQIFQTVLHIACFPVFVWFKLYFRWKCPGAGVLIYAVAQKAG